MSRIGTRRILALVLAGLIGGIGYTVITRSSSPEPAAGERSVRAVPVEVAPIERGPIELRRTFSGSIEASAKFLVAPKVSGRIERLAVDLADPVERGQVVAELDNAEYVQAVSQAVADLAVARAKFTEAKNGLEIASRELSRVKTLLDRGIASEAQYDTARAEELEKQARLEVAEAQVARAESALETAQIRLGYTRINADWTGGNSGRVVAERMVDEGQTVSANTPLLSIVELDPVTGVIFVTERDYSRMQPGQKVRLTTGACPDTIFEGEIARISPVFRQATRQARVELEIENSDLVLKPGMFIMATVMLDRVDNAVIVPESALTRRENRTGIFAVDPDSRSVSWHEVKIGIRENGRVQLLGSKLSGRVVTLGQQLLDDGSVITIPDQNNPGDDRTASTSGFPAPKTATR